MIQETESASSIPRLSAREKEEIEHKIDDEIVRSHHSMLKLGAIANIMGGFFYVLFLYKHLGPDQRNDLSIWYFVLVTSNIINMFWAMRFEADSMQTQLYVWRRVFLFILPVICLTWGSIGILFYTNGAQYQFITLVFLLAVLISFTFSTVMEFTIAAISISCLLLPTISYQIYLGIHDFLYAVVSPALNFGVTAAFVVLGIFMLGSCYIGNNLIRKYFRVSFENELLSSKLGKVNEFLEKRVKERTHELEKSLKLVKYQATHDLLTELPNKMLLQEYLHTAIDDAIKNKHKFAVVWITINEIKRINEALGPQTSEVIIKRISQRLQNTFNKEPNKGERLPRYSVTISREDVFIVLIHPIKPEEIDAKVKFLFSLLKDPVIVENHPVHLTASIGVSVYPRDGLDANSLIMHANSAALHAEQYGGNSIFVYEAGIDSDYTRKLNIESMLHNALQNHEFKVEYQPLIDLKTAKICGMEALIRWYNPTLGKLSPDEFIPIAEANGTIIAIGEWILRTACKQTAQWHAKGFTNLQVSVNLSAKQLQQKGIAQNISSILINSNLKPQYLKLELTESKAFRDDVIPIINEIHSLGISLSIDDFGTGYSAFSRLKLFDINQIKIDKSFINDIITNNDSREIVLNTIALGKRMNIKVVAEGVETVEQVDFLRQHGCDIIQGYYFSRPLDPDAFTNLLYAQVNQVDG